MNDEIVTLSNDPSGAEYDIVSTVDVKLNVADNDNPGVNISKQTLTVREEDTTGDSYTVALFTLPLANVTVTVAGYSGTDVTPFPTTLTFTSQNWETAQTVTVTAANDADTVNDVVTLTHSATSTEQDYRGITIASVEVTVTDNDTAGVMIEPTALSVVAGRSNEYTVRLATEPTGNVTVGVTLPAGTDLSLDKTTLTFTVVNWDTAQTVIVSATENAATAKVTLAHAVAGSDYGSVTAEPVVVSVVGVAGQQPTLQVGVSELTQTLTVPEGGANSYILVLGSRPTGDVTVGVTLPTGTDLTLSSDMLTFTSTNWDVVQTVTVTAAEDDDAANDTVTLTHSATSTDSDYNLITIASVVVTVADNDPPGMTVTPSTLELYVGEGATATYTVKLDTAPTGDVTVAIASNNTEAATVSPASLTFMPTDWNTAQTVTVTGVEDDDRTDESVTLSNNPSGAEYDSVDTVSVDLRVGDNDLARVSVSKTALTVVEEDTTGNSYTVALVAQPTADVTVTVAGHSGTDVTPSPTSLTFMPTDWNTPKTVTVTAANDEDTADDMVTLTHSAASTDAGYHSINIASVDVTVTDNDTATSVNVSETELTVEEEDPTGGSYTVALSAEPTADVTVTVAGHAGTDVILTPDPPTLTFTSQNWAMAQTVTVKAANDADTDGDTVTLTHSAASSDSDYDLITIASVVVTVTDNDPPAL